MRRVVLTALVTCLASCNSQPVERKEEAKPDPRQLELSRVKAKLTQNLKDPSSAQFRNVRRLSFLDMGDKDPWSYSGHYCGEINGKNSFGAYIGFQKFHMFGPDPTGKFPDDPVTISDPSVPASSIAYLSFCENNGKAVEGIPIEFPK